MIITRIPQAFTTASPQVLRPGTGVAGVTHRYLGADIPAAAGTVASSWSDRVGGISLTGANGPTVRALANGRKYLEFDGVNDTLRTTALGAVATVVLIARTRANDTNYTQIASGAGVSVTRAGQAGTAINPGSQVIAPVSTINTWRFIVATATATEATVTVDGVTATAAPAGVWAGTLSLGANGTPAFFSALDIIEAYTVPNALTTAERADAWAAARAAYPDLLP